MALRREDGMFPGDMREYFEYLVILILGLAFMIALVGFGPWASTMRATDPPVICIGGLIVGIIFFAAFIIALARLGIEQRKRFIGGWWSTEKMTKNFFPAMMSAMVVVLILYIVAPPGGHGSPVGIFFFTMMAALLPLSTVQYRNMRRFPALATMARPRPDETSAIIEKALKRSGRRYQIARKKVYQYGRMKRFIINDGTEVRVSRARCACKAKSFILVGPYNKKFGRRVTRLAERIDSELRSFSE